jgi:predicted transcriptional regulator
MRIGNKELEILSYIAENPGKSLREITDHVMEATGVGRTTVIKTVERLITKGFVARRGYWGSYEHYACRELSDIKESLTQQFVRETLNGSIAPFVAYLRGGASVTPEEVAQLKSLVEELEREGRK